MWEPPVLCGSPQTLWEYPECCEINFTASYNYSNYVPRWTVSNVGDNYPLNLFYSLYTTSLCGRTLRVDIKSCVTPSIKYLITLAWEFWVP
jgi:hypothetical protein